MKNWYKFAIYIESRTKESSNGWSSIDVPPLLKSKIAAFAKKIDKEDIYTTEADDQGWNYGIEPDSHITLLYGFTKEAKFDDFKKIVNDFGSFEVEFDGLSIFDTNEKYDVLKIGVKGEKLHKLHEIIKENMPNNETYPEYKPHITVSYMKKGKAEKYLKEALFKNEKFKVEKINFETWDNIKNSIKLN